MSALAAELARLRALEQAATPGPWPEPRIEDQQFLTALRNRARALLDVVEAARRSRPGFSQESERVGGDAIDEALAALAALAKEAVSVTR